MPPSRNFAWVLDAAVISAASACTSTSGPLDIIPRNGDDDPLVECRDIGTVSYSRLVDPLPVDEVDHPAVEALHAALRSPGPEPLPVGGWSVMRIEDDSATFAIVEGDVITWRASFRPDGERWVPSGFRRGNRDCDGRIVLPSGLAHVEVHLDPDTLPQPSDTSIDLLATEIDCANGRQMGDALQGPQIVETDDEVLVALAVIPIAGGATCPGNPSAAVTVELLRPLGDRVLLNGARVPPEPIQLRPDR